MKLLRAFPLAALALVVLAIVCFCVATGQVTLLIVTGAVGALSWYVCEGPRGYALPKWLANILIIVASAAMVPDVLAHRYEVVSVLGRYAVWIALIKLYERKDRRDYAQLLWLSLLLVIAGVLKSRELLFGVALLLYSGLGIFVLLLYQLYAGYEASQEQRLAAAPDDAHLIPLLRPVLGRTVKGQFMAASGGIAVVGMFAAAVVFAGFPRDIGYGMVKRFLQPPEINKTGFVNQVRLRTGSRIGESKTPVFEVRLLNPEGAPVEYGEPMYLRGAALGEYDPDTYTWLVADPRSARTSASEAGPDNFTALAVLPSDEAEHDALAGAYTLEFAPLTAMGDTVFTLASPLALSTQASGQFTFNRRTHAITLARSNRLNTYRVRSDPFPSAETLQALNGGIHATAGTQHPYSDARVHVEAVRLLNEANLPVRPPGGFPERGDYNRRAARVFNEYLSTNFRYTLNLSEVKIEGDPIVGFLFDFKKGHCEYFASALTAMCQTIGIEARVVTGFLGAEYEGDGYYKIRESNAHAWAEVRTSQYGFQTFDPSPPGIIEEYHLPSHTLADRVRGIYEFFEAGWIRGIIDFDDASQAQLQHSLTFDSFGWLDDAAQSAAAWVTRFVRRFGFAGTLQIVVVSAAGLVAIMIVIRLVRRARRIRRTLHLEHLRGSEYRRLMRRLGFYLDMLDLLRRGGLAKPLWQPPLAFADAIEVARPNVVDPVRAITRAFYCARYGGVEITPDEAETTRAALDRLASALSVKR